YYEVLGNFVNYSSALGPSARFTLHYVEFGCSCCTLLCLLDVLWFRQYLLGSFLTERIIFVSCCFIQTKWLSGCLSGLLVSRLRVWWIFRIANFFFIYYFCFSFRYKRYVLFFRWAWWGNRGY